MYKFYNGFCWDNIEGNRIWLFFIGIVREHSTNIINTKFYEDDWIFVIYSFTQIYVKVLMKPYITSEYHIIYKHIV